jgi:hypothetical protein
MKTDRSVDRSGRLTRGTRCRSSSELGVELAECRFSATDAVYATGDLLTLVKEFSVDDSAILIVDTACSGRGRGSLAALAQTGQDVSITTGRGWFAQSWEMQRIGDSVSNATILMAI